MKVVYGVQYIEIEFGQRPFGWRLYLGLEDCKKQTRIDRKNGYCDGQYLGPIYPMYCIEIPFDSLDNELKNILSKKGYTATPYKWMPKFTGERTIIQ